MIFGKIGLPEVSWTLLVVYAVAVACASDTASQPSFPITGTRPEALLPKATCQGNHRRREDGHLDVARPLQPCATLHCHSWCAIMYCSKTTLEASYGGVDDLCCTEPSVKRSVSTTLTSEPWTGCCAWIIRQRQPLEDTSRHVRARQHCRAHCVLTLTILRAPTTNTRAQHH